MSTNSSEEMTFWDHLEVMRRSIFRVLAVLSAAFVVSFIAMPYIFDDFVLGASKGDFFSYKFLGPLFKPDFAVDIININVTTPFFTHMSTAFWFALVLTFPYLVFEVWRFVSPALYPSEKKGAGAAFLGGSILFYFGCALGYCLIFPITFRFLAEYHIGNDIVNQIALNSYISNFLTIIFLMGVVFEIPMLCWLLSALGLLHKGFLRKNRRYAIVILLVLAAVITPTGDPFTLMVVFLPVYALYEFSILIVKKDEES